VELHETLKLPKQQTQLSDTIFDLFMPVYIVTIIHFKFVFL